MFNFYTKKIVLYIPRSSGLPRMPQGSRHVTNISARVWNGIVTKINTNTPTYLYVFCMFLGICTYKSVYVCVGGGGGGGVCIYMYAYRVLSLLIIFNQAYCAFNKIHLKLSIAYGTTSPIAVNDWRYLMPCVSVNILHICINLVYSVTFQIQILIFMCVLVVLSRLG